MNIKSWVKSSVYMSLKEFNSTILVSGGHPPSGAHQHPSQQAPQEEKRTLAEKSSTSAHTADMENKRIFKTPEKKM